MKHAKTPWYYEQDGGAPYLVGNDGYDRVVEGVGKPITANANLRHIAKCVNAHDALVAALESTTRQLEIETAPNTTVARPDYVVAARELLVEAGIKQVKSCSLPPDTKEDDLQSETWRRTNAAAWDMVTKRCEI